MDSCIVNLNSQTEHSTEFIEFCLDIGRMSSKGRGSMDKNFTNNLMEDASNKGIVIALFVKLVFFNFNDFLV